VKVVNGKQVGGGEARCEWELMQILKKTGQLDALKTHRDTYITRDDLVRIKAAGLNAVRMPFGYWTVIGATTKKEPYVGPCLEYIDKLVRWAEELDLQVLLDLHGAPGGESAEAPCGRRQRPASLWRAKHWRFRESLIALEVIARRYCGSSAVTGIAVCNEPAPEVPTARLCRFYLDAIETVRNAGMDPQQVTVVLPVFQRSLSVFMTQWVADCKIIARKRSNAAKTISTSASSSSAIASVSDSSNQLAVGAMDDIGHGDICFEVHWYHCFENEWHGYTFAQHIRALQRNATELKSYPIVVGEWSLAVGRGAQPGILSKEDMRQFFAALQVAAYSEASHGWFFWTWSDVGGGPEWDFQVSHRQGAWSNILELSGGLKEPPQVQAQRDARDDPLERLLDVPAADPSIRLGDTIYLRSFNGSYLDVEGPRVRARYGDRGKWQQFVLCPAERGTCGSKDAKAAVARAAEEGLCDGDVVCILAHTGRFIGLDDSLQVEARYTEVEAACSACKFVLRTPLGVGSKVRHRSVIFLVNYHSSKVLAPNESDPGARDDIVAKWEDLGCWQRMVIEKPLCTAVTPHRPRRRSLARLPQLTAPRTFPSRRGSGVNVPANSRCASRGRSTAVGSHKAAAMKAKRGLGKTTAASKVKSRFRTAKKSLAEARARSVGAMAKRSTNFRPQASSSAPPPGTPLRSRRSIAATPSSPGNRVTGPTVTTKASDATPCSARKRRSSAAADGCSKLRALVSAPSTPSANAISSFSAARDSPERKGVIAMGNETPLRSQASPLRRRQSEAQTPRAPQTPRGTSCDPDLEELASMTTPSRRRRISGGSQHLLSLLLATPSAALAASMPSPAPQVPVLPLLAPGATLGAQRSVAP